MPHSGMSYKFCHTLTRHYGKFFTLCVALIVAMCAVSVGQYSFMIEQSEQSSYDWTVSEAEQSEQRDALEWARDHQGLRVRMSVRSMQSSDDDDDEEVRTRSEQGSSMTIVYQHLGFANESIFTPANLKAMCEVENVLLGDREYPKFCFNGKSTVGYTRDGENRRCAKQQMSIVSLYYLAWTEWSPVLSPNNASYPFSSLDDGALGFLQLYQGIPVIDGVPPNAPKKESDVYDGHTRVCDELSSAYVTNRTKQILKLVDYSDDTRSLLGFFLSKDVEDTGFSELTRSSLVVAGQPLEGFDDEEDREDEQDDIYEVYNLRMERKLFDFFGMQDTQFRSAYRSDEPPVDGRYPSAATQGGVDVRYMGPWSDEEFNRMVNSDLMWVIGSVSFVLIYMTVHTYSLWLACIGMFQIFTSLPVAFFFYRVVGQVDYFVQLHILTIFLVLGVGADDVFVYVDSWKQASVDPHLDTQVKRVLYTWSHTAQSVFNTSFTTASAFFATALNPVMPISSFGIFAALAIIINYIFTITLFPATVLIWENDLRQCWAKIFGGTFERVPWGLDPPSPKELRSVGPAFGGTDAMAAKPAAVDSESGSRTAAGDSVRSFSAATTDAPMGSFGPTSGVTKDAPKEGAQPSTNFSDPGEKLRWFERMFREYYAPALNWAPTQRKWLKPVSLACVLAFTVLGVTGTYYASLLQPPTEQEQWFTEDHMFTGFEDLNSDRFLSGGEDEYAEMSIVLGISGISRPNYVRWNPADNRGTATFDETFDLRSRRAQNAVQSLCDVMRDAPCDVEACVGGFGTLVRPDTLECFIEDFDKWYVDAYNSSLPDSYTKKDRPTGDEFIDLLKEFYEAGEDTSSSVGFVDGELKYVEIPFTATMLGFQPFVTTLSYYEAVHEALDAAVADLGEAGEDLGENPFVYAGRHFTWVVTEKALVDGVLQGFAICFPVAFVVLVVATGSPRLSIFAILSIALIVGTTLGFCKAVMGWGLGVAESISSTIVIGFSVDYVVHLGHAYRESWHASREGKTSDALTTMGITVVAGAVTTLGSGTFMWACQMTFFTKMAVLITAVIVLSISFALCFFMPLCAIWGPEGEMKSFAGYMAEAKEKAKTTVRRASLASGRRSSGMGAQEGQAPADAVPPQETQTGTQ